MTAKSQSRRDRDAKARAAAGGKAQSTRVQREKTTRAWYELKTVHMRSQAYIQQLAARMSQYDNPLVLVKIAKNGDDVRFNEVQVELQKAAGIMATEFSNLWDMHKDKKKLCLSMKELEEANVVFNEYQKFDIDFFNIFQPLIAELNRIFNKALTQLLEAQEALKAETIDSAKAKMLDPSVVSDVNYEPVPDSAAMPAAIEDLNKESAVQVIEDGAFAQVEQALGTSKVMAAMDDAAFKEVAEAELAKYEVIGGEAPAEAQPVEVVEYHTGFGGASA